MNKKRKMQKNIVENESSRVPIIFQLTPNITLADKEKTQSFGKYFNYLEAAFQDQQIHNIAVTGHFGIGKSSMIRSYEQRRRKARAIDKNQHVLQRLWQKFNGRSDADKAFLYVSLGSFEQSDLGSQALVDSEKKDQKVSKKNHKTEKDSNADLHHELNAIERRLLLQIYASFRQKDLPLSNFRLVPEMAHRRGFAAVLLGMLACAALLLHYSKELGMLAVSLANEKLPLLFRPFGVLLRALVASKTALHLGLYIFVITVISLIAGRFCFHLLSYFHFHNFTLKSDHIEMAMEKEACDNYLDLYSMELVYCLEQLVDRIDGTIVFEDFDRFPASVCVQVFSRLREINYLVNLRLANINKSMRFVYVIKDDILSDFIHHKFFDYVLPMIPYLNERSSEKILIEGLNKIHQRLKVQVSIDFECFARKVAPYIADFRLQNTILNEYCLLFELYCANNSSNDREHDAVQLLAFSIYKNICPRDYHRFVAGEGELLPKDSTDHCSKTNHQKLLSLLVDGPEPLLTPRCLYYAGFSEKTIAEMRKNRWENASPEEIIQDIRTIEKIDYENLEVLRKYCSNGNIPDDVIIEAIRCMTRCNSKNNEWFFKERKIRECLRILAKLDDNKVKNRFFALSALEGTPSVFGISEQEIAGLHDITYEKLVELCRGFPHFSGVEVRVDGKEIKLEENNTMIQEIRESLKS